MFIVLAVDPITGKWRAYWLSTFTTRAAAWAWAAVHPQLGGSIVTQINAPVDPPPQAGTTEPVTADNIVGSILVVKGPVYVEYEARMFAFGAFLPSSAPELTYNAWQWIVRVCPPDSCCVVTVEAAPA